MGMASADDGASPRTMIATKSWRTVEGQVRFDSTISLANLSERQRTVSIASNWTRALCGFRLQRFDLLHLLADFFLSYLQIVIALKVCPEAGTGTEITSKMKCSVGGDTNFLFGNTLDSSTWKVWRLRYCMGERSSGLRNSSRRTSPGCIGASLFVIMGLLGRYSVVVDDLHIDRAVLPLEAHAKLIVDSNRMLAGSVAFQRLETVAGRTGKVGKDNGCMDHPKFTARYFDQIAWKAFRRFAIENSLRQLVTEALDHSN